MKRLKGALCVLLALVLVLTGLNLQLHRAQPLFGTELPDTGISAFLTAVPAPRQDACLTGAETGSITPVLRQQSTSRLEPLRLAETAAVCGLSLCTESGSPVQRLRCWHIVPAPGRRAITSHIHRTRRKRC